MLALPPTGVSEKSHKIGMDDNRRPSPLPDQVTVKSPPDKLGSVYVSGD